MPHAAHLTQTLGRIGAVLMLPIIAVVGYPAGHLPVVAASERRLSRSDRPRAAGPSSARTCTRPVDGIGRDGEQRTTYRRLAFFFIGFLGLWSAAWLLALTLSWSAATAYWAVAKVIVWVLYPLAFWRAPVRKHLAFIGLRNRSALPGLAWGAVMTVAWVTLSLVVAPLRGQHLAPTPLTFGVLYTSLLTPACEEWLFRGYLQSIMTSLGSRFWITNTVTSSLFLLPHVIGWGFQGVLANNVASVLPLSIFAVSLLLGYTRHRSASLLGSVLLHAGNNVVSIFLR